jgi:PAS domain S-box-containing protein
MTPPVEQSASQTSRRILMVDDDEFDRLAVRRSLLQAGIAATVDEAKSATETLERMRSASYDCVLLDYYLPDLDGLALLAEIRVGAPDIPVVVFTGRGDEEIAVELMKAGAVDYLPKASLTPERLAASLRHAIELARTAADKRRAEEERRAQEDHFRTLANAIPQLAWMADASGWRYWYNQQWFDYTGRTLEETQGWDWQKLHHPEDVQRVLDSFRRSLGTGEPWEETFPLRGKDGTFRWFLTRALPIRDEHGQIVRWLGTSTDITEQKWTEALLAGERQAFELLARGSSLAVVLESLTRTIEGLAGDGLLASILLLDQDGVHLRHGAAPSLPETYIRAIDGLAIGPSAGSCGTAAYRSEPVVVTDIAADPLWADYRDLALPHGLRACWSTPIRGTDGRVLGTFALYYHEPRAPSPEHFQLAAFVGRSAATIIERQRADETRARLTAVVDSSDDAIIGKALDGIITDWNPGAARLYGYTAEEMISQPLIRIIPPDRLNEYDDVMAQVRRGERVPAFDTVRLHKDGYPVEVSLSLSPIVDEAGVVVGISAIARDIRERRALERLQQEFLAMVSHELRNPIAGVKGYAQLLKRRGVYNERAVDTIIDQAGTLERLVQDLVDASRVQLGQLELELDQMDLVAAARACADQVQAQTQEHTIRIEVPDHPLEGCWDRTRLGQVLHNLLTNAIKYSPDGGEVLVRVEDLSGQVRTSVRDQGRGIAPDKLTRVFERFYRADPSVEAARSLGLGLYITRAIVESHGGQIWAESEGEGQGSTFVFTLPIAVPAPPPRD